MNNKVNYTLVGFLVLVGFILMVSFTYWLMQPSSEEEVKKYYIHFDESVLGLNIDAPVKYRGISVGKVSSLKINPNNMEQVQILITILKTTPIKEDTIAKLTAQGITGLSYINLSMGSRDAKELLAKENEKYPVIKTLPSFFENIEQSFGSVSEKVSIALTQTNKLLNDENQREFSLILKRASSLLEKLDRTLDENTIKNIQSTVKNFDDISDKANRLTPKFGAFIDSSTEWEDKIAGSFDSIMHSYTGIKGSMAEIRRAVKSGEFNIKDIASDVVPTMNNTLIDVQELIIRLDGLLETYERSPGDILFTKEKAKKGPGE
ncbi:MAG: MlaD family protein [Sulfurimonas sp.]|nr:MlaD family protein [Sulfurimonas sp.]MDQ7059945.1 MlaD family protein [Sulfurimonas sp.]